MLCDGTLRAPAAPVRKTRSAGAPVWAQHSAQLSQRDQTVPPISAPLHPIIGALRTSRGPSRFPPLRSVLLVSAKSPPHRRSTLILVSGLCSAPCATRSHTRSAALPSVVPISPAPRRTKMQLPTAIGIRVRSMADAHVIFHAVSLGVLPIVSRRLDVDERRYIHSGCVCVWEERSAFSEGSSVRRVHAAPPHTARPCVPFPRSVAPLNLRLIGDRHRAVDGREAMGPFQSARREYLWSFPARHHWPFSPDRVDRSSSTTRKSYPNSRLTRSSLHSCTYACPAFSLLINGLTATRAGSSSRRTLCLSIPRRAGGSGT